MAVHVPENIMNQLHKVFEEVLGKQRDVEVILFGSRATNQHRPDSDIDLAVRGTEGRGDLLESLEKALHRDKFNIEVEVVAEEDSSPATLKRIKNEGIRIWPTE